MGGCSGREVQVQDPELMRKLEKLTQDNAALQRQFSEYMANTKSEMEKMRLVTMREQLQYEAVS